MTPTEFVAKWQKNPLTERQPSHTHFIDLRALSIPREHRDRGLLDGPDRAAISAASVHNDAQSALKFVIVTMGHSTP